MKSLLITLGLEKLTVYSDQLKAHLSQLNEPISRQATGISELHDALNSKYTRRCDGKQLIIIRVETPRTFKVAINYSIQESSQGNGCRFPAQFWTVVTSEKRVCGVEEV